MHLHSIKLSGFKSFVDLTTFVLPGRLVGVVGPNGCGKSNIIDAVRWVLGESKASELRGETMQDVIFNGTDQRRSASRASVELVFDNTDQRAGGQWGRFTEIAVRRVLTRDGASSYYLNGQSVRRRDVQDVFLGTGLGPRAYAIIGQGTISRIIESKPHELRLFLEEAAGVSRYKERRRETEARMADTRDNLTRSADILRELDGQLEKLEQQAAVAKRWHALQAEITKKSQQQWLLQREQHAAAQRETGQAIAGVRADAERCAAELLEREAQLESVREAHFAAADALTEAQGRLYEASAEAGRLEAEIRFVADSRKRIDERLRQLRDQAAQWQARAAAAAREHDEIGAATADAAARAAQLDAEHAAQAHASAEAEQALQHARERRDSQRAQLAQLQQQHQLAAAEARHLAEQSELLGRRRERLQHERRALERPDAERLAALAREHTAAQAHAGELDARLHELQARLPELDAARRAAQQRLNEHGAQQTGLAARHAALQALQDKVATDGRLRPWLARHGLDGATALWRRIRVAPGWETAFEAALRERVGALELDALEAPLREFEAAPPPARLAVFCAPAAAARTADAAPPPPPGCTPLIDHLEAGERDAGLHALLCDWLRGCHSAPDVDTALAARTQLPAAAAIYLRSGHAIDAHGMRCWAPDTEQAGILARAHEIGELEQQLAAQAPLTEQARRDLAQAEAGHTAASQQLAAVRRATADAQAAAHRKQVEQLRATQQAEQAERRAGQLDAELAEIETQREALAQRDAAGAALRADFERQRDAAQQQAAQLAAGLTDAERAAASARERQRALERQAHEAAFEQRSLQARAAELGRSIDDAAEQLRANTEAQAEAQAELARLSDDAARAGWQAALAAKAQCEAGLAEQRRAGDALAAQLRALDEQRLTLQRALDPLRERLGELQLAAQAAQLGLEQFDRLLDEADADRAALAASVEHDGVRLGGLPGAIERLQCELAALGAVNLAALDELGSARERQQFLQAQSADLADALATLEDAIRTIDAETRELLGQTFETVNGHFGAMFPELFGGGQARLVLTGDEILDAGVQVLAQPPGKKNQTIHLLSGGEKALTAIALVFAMFKLNPAPFCLLDEVDAPLDDANTERYAKLVTRMSQDTQFLFISHNRIAMEMAEQLIGVTMQEQGVSRVVAVDMESAAALAEAEA